MGGWSGRREAGDIPIPLSLVSQAAQGSCQSPAQKEELSKGTNSVLLDSQIHRRHKCYSIIGEWDRLLVAPKDEKGGCGD